jgi:hypothetical protein
MDYKAAAIQESLSCQFYQEGFEHKEIIEGDSINLAAHVASRL